MLSQIVTKLAGKANLRSVEGVVGLAAVKGPPVNTPCAFVFPLSDTAGPNHTLNAVDQRVDQTFGVLVILRGAGDLKGAKAADVIAVRRDEINAELVGWQPEGAETSIEYLGGALVDLIDDTVWWLFRYRNAFRIWS
ncbi:hypothetical protein ACJ41P_31805 [Azospirillum argentinense]|uniref:Uncharacterized protein n=1 Tax=Azospirillum argentinense TaxID=2970906 RepID=A0ABW8VHF9_9PROT